MCLLDGVQIVEHLVFETGHREQLKDLTQAVNLENVSVAGLIRFEVYLIVVA